MTVLRNLIGAVLLVFTVGIAHAQTININSADLDELTQLEGVGQSRARALIEERDANGPFDSHEDVQNRVNGIGPATIENNRERMSFE
jgi:competence protein ComEA